MDRIRSSGTHHVASLGWSCKFYASARCMYHRDAAKTYWTLAKLEPHHPVQVGKVLDCIDEMEIDMDYETRYMDNISDCLREFK